MNKLISTTAFTGVFLLLLWIPINLSAQTKIMPIGNSITQGMNVTWAPGLTNLYSYRRPLWLMLQSAGKSVDFVGSMTEVEGTPLPLTDFDKNHEGHAGWRTDQLLYDRGWYDGLGTVGDWIKLHMPDMVLLHTGTNDCAQGQSSASTVVEIGSVIDTMRFHNPAIKIYLAKLIGSGYSWNAKIDSINNAIPALAALKSTLASPIVVVDMSSVFDPSIHTSEGIHPNPTGEQIMAQAWFDAIAPATFPVEMLSFSAIEMQNQVRLKWATATEINNAGFEVQMMRRGVFEQIGYVEGNGTTTSVSNYEFQTEVLAKGTYLFRLRQVDIDGQSSFSDRISVEIKDSFEPISLYPNPATDQVWVEVPAENPETIDIRVFDMRGMAVSLPVHLQSQTNAITTWELNTASCLPGLYFVNISGEGLSYTKKLMITP
jgi:hypothetical protein